MIKLFQKFLVFGAFCLTNLTFAQVQAPASAMA
jgi:hypothetical protein